MRLHFSHVIPTGLWVFHVVNGHSEATKTPLLREKRMGIHTYWSKFEKVLWRGSTDIHKELKLLKEVLILRDIVFWRWLWSVTWKMIVYLWLCAVWYWYFILWFPFPFLWCIPVFLISLFFLYVSVFLDHQENLTLEEGDGSEALPIDVATTDPNIGGPGVCLPRLTPMHCRSWHFSSCIFWTSWYTPLTNLIGQFRIPQCLPFAEMWNPPIPRNYPKMWDYPEVSYVMTRQRFLYWGSRRCSEQYRQICRLRQTNMSHSSSLMWVPVYTDVGLVREKVAIGHITYNMG